MKSPISLKIRLSSRKTKTKQNKTQSFSAPMNASMLSSEPEMFLSSRKDPHLILGYPCLPRLFSFLRQSGGSGDRTSLRESAAGKFRLVPSVLLLVFLLPEPPPPKKGTVSGFYFIFFVRARERAGVRWKLDGRLVTRRKRYSGQVWHFKLQ